MRSYNNFYKACAALRRHLDETGLTGPLLDYLKNSSDFSEDGQMELPG